MKTTDLIQAILRTADNLPRAQAEHVVDPLRYFGQVWFAGGHWWFSEQRAEIATYTASSISSSAFGDGQFEEAADRDVSVSKVVVGTYDDRAYYLVRGAKDAEDALSQVKVWYEKNYAGGWSEWETTTIEEITIEKGVTRL